MNYLIKKSFHSSFFCDPIQLQQLAMSLHSTMQTTINTYLTKISQSSAYSLAIESHSNIEDLQLYSLYFHFLNENLDSEICSFLLNTGVGCHTAAQLEMELKDFKISNCSAIITNFEKDQQPKSLKEFTQKYGNHHI